MSGFLGRAAHGLLGAVGVLGLWQASAVSGPLAGAPLPTAGEAIARALQLTGTTEMWIATGETLVVAFAGLLLGLVVGVSIGIAIGVSPLLMHALRGPLEFLKPIPPIVILPIAVLVLGPTAEMGIFLVFFGSVFVIAIQTATGVQDTDPVAIDTGRSYGMSRSEILRRIVLPSALPYLGTGIRVAAPMALIISVVAGLLGGGPGLGQSLVLAQVSGDQATLFAYVLILGLLGIVVQHLVQAVETRLLHWHPQYRKIAP